MLPRSARVRSLALALAVALVGVAGAPERAAAQSGDRAAERAPWSQAKRDRAFRIMLEGSLNVSRTKKKGEAFLAPKRIQGKTVQNRAEKNFRRAARFVVDNAHELPLNKETAIKINKMVTDGLVPEGRRGNPTDRRNSADSHKTDPMVGGKVENFYEWLGREGAASGKKDPVALAEKIHHNMSALDSFPDGNGRTARLMADLALMKHDRAPAAYTPMKDYFRRGNARSDASRREKAKYFREIVRRGQKKLREAKKDKTSRKGNQRTGQKKRARTWLRSMRGKAKRKVRRRDAAQNKSRRVRAQKRRGKNRHRSRGRARGR